ERRHGTREADLAGREAMRRRRELAAWQRKVDGLAAVGKHLDGDHLPSGIDAPRLLLTDPSSTGSRWRR
ncbi:unnamed protein product, partial [Urochloa humidicola]